MNDQKDTSSNTPNNSGNEKDTDSRVAYISQKAERMAGALYAVTRFFPADEPLRHSIRRRALSLVSSAHALNSNSQEINTDKSAPTLLTELRSQLRVARDGGLISPMNFSVLDDEISTFIQEVLEIGVFPGPSLGDEYFSEDRLPSSGESRKTSSLQSSSLNSKGKRITQPHTESAEGSAGSSDGSTDTPTKELSAKERRRIKILELFDDKEEITVNDVTEVINGYSTKTIQRDLKALVEQGKIQKHGKRRWTYYTKR